MVLLYIPSYLELSSSPNFYKDFHAFIISKISNYNPNLSIRLFQLCQNIQFNLKGPCEDPECYLSFFGGIYHYRVSSSYHDWSIACQTTSWNHLDLWIDPRFCRILSRKPATFTVSDQVSQFTNHKEKQQYFRH